MNDEKGYVYFIADDSANAEYVKIGFSKNPKKRLSDLQVANPKELVLIGMIELDQVGEKMIHKYLKENTDAYVRGEWFKLNAMIWHLNMWLPLKKIPYRELHEYTPDQRDERIDARLNMSRYNLENAENIRYYNFSQIVHKKELEYAHLFFNVSPTKANQHYFDSYGDLIRAGDTYYRVDDGGGDYSFDSKLSKKSFISILYFAKQLKFPFPDDYYKKYKYRTISSSELIKSGGKTKWE